MADAPSSDADQSERIIAALCRARETARPVYITAGGSKRHMAGRDCTCANLDLSGHRGVVDYQPRELVITARGGTPLEEILALLETEGQTLSFEPPLFAGRATVGGTLACNLSGPGRPWGGSVRDRVLGVQLFNGKAQRLRFGGQVMKNVAGYDVSRLQAGALGTLGVLSEVSLKVDPIPERSLTLRYEMTADAAIATMNRRAGEPRPLTGAFWQGGQLYLRLAGAASAVAHTAALWGGDLLDTGAEFWTGLREMTLPFFGGEQPLWRLSVQATAPVPPGHDLLIDWCGAQRWLRGHHSRPEMDRLAGESRGHATLFRGGDRAADIHAPLPAAGQRLHKRLKHAFDPDGILNPGRLYAWL